MEKFNWVNARAECSPIQMFVRLKVGLEADVEERNRLRGEKEQVRFTCEQEATKLFVCRESNQGSSIVEFALHADGIMVSPPEANIRNLLATVTLDRDGQCKLSVSGQPWEEWQLRKFALEHLFFGP